MFNILVFNCGSSSLMYKLFGLKSLTDNNPSNFKILVSGKGHRVGTTTTQLSFLEHNVTSESETFRQEVPLVSYEFTAELIIQFLTCNGRGFNEVIPKPSSLKPFHIDLVGHRFVHGGTEFDSSTLIDDVVYKKLVDCLPLAPIHNPIALSVHEVSRRLLTAPSFVVFDTAFHRSVSAAAATYALPIDLAKKYPKYGFHGLSYKDVTDHVERYLGGKGSLNGKKMAVCHLGTGGSSICAIESGKSIDHSMGYSPLQGLVMSTRCGNIDVSIPLDLIKNGHSVDEVENILNTRSGLLGLSTLSSDLRDIYQVAQNVSHPKCERCRLAFAVCVHRLRYILGEMIAALGGIDILAFTDGLGVEMPQLRDAVCSSFAFCGIKIDQSKNNLAVRWDQIGDISASDSRVKVLVVPNDEELVVAVEGQALANTYLSKKDK